MPSEARHPYHHADCRIGIPRSARNDRFGIYEIASSKSSEYFGCNHTHFHVCDNLRRYGFGYIYRACQSL